MRASQTEPSVGVRVCHLTTVHSWDDTRIFRKQCISLSRAGFDVSLVAPDADNAIRAGVTLIPGKRYKSRLARMTLGTIAALRLGLASGASIFHYHDPELIPAGFLLRLLGKAVIYDVHEDYPRQMTEKRYLPPFWLRVIGRLIGGLELVAGLSASAVVAVTPTIGNRFPKSKTWVIQNYVMLRELEDKDALDYNARPAEVIYVGSIGTARCLREMLDAVELLPETLDARLRLVGAMNPSTVPADLQTRLETGPRIVLAGQQSRPMVATLLGRARIGVLVYQPTTNNINGQPNKLFEYMSAGLPVIGSDFPLWREIILGVNCGLVVDPRDASALAAAIEYLLTHEDEAREMGQRGRRAVAERFNWGHEEKLLIELYRKLSCAHAQSRNPENPANSTESAALNP